LSVLRSCGACSAKSWAAAIVSRLKQEGVLEDAPDGACARARIFQARRAGRLVTTSARRRGGADLIETAATTWHRKYRSGGSSVCLTFRIVTIGGLDGARVRREVGPWAERRRGAAADALRRAGPPYESSPSRLKDNFLFPLPHRAWSQSDARRLCLRRNAALTLDSADAALGGSACRRTAAHGLSASDSVLGSSVDVGRLLQLNSRSRNPA